MLFIVSDRKFGEKIVNFKVAKIEQAKIQSPMISERIRYITVVAFSFLNIPIPPYSYSPTIFGPEILSAYTKKRFSVKPSVSKG